MDKSMHWRLALGDITPVQLGLVKPVEKETKPAAVLSPNQVKKYKDFIIPLIQAGESNHQIKARVKLNKSLKTVPQNYMSSMLHRFRHRIQSADTPAQRHRLTRRQLTIFNGFVTESIAMGRTNKEIFELLEVNKLHRGMSRETICRYTAAARKAAKKDRPQPVK